MKIKVVKGMLLCLLLSTSIFILPTLGMTATAADAAAGLIDKVQESRIEGLEHTIEELRKDKVEEKQSLSKKLIISLTLLLIGSILFVFLKIGLKKFEEVISEKEAIRESDNTLRIKTIVRLFHWAGSIAIICAISYMVLENFGVNVAPLLAGAGIVGLAFGFGGQYLIRDLINGIFILLEGQYGVNDIVKIGDFSGAVESVNLRITVLRDGEGRVIFIPNGDIKTVVNMTKDYSRAVLKVGVAYKENIDHVMDVIEQVGKELRQDGKFKKLILDDLDMLGVDDLADSQVVIRFQIKTLPSKEAEVARELRRRIKNRFDELKIELPYPHQTIYWGTGQDNDWFRNSHKK